jgi:regulator of protease activity HflC (stomatin/prohibitin superfamily)
MAEIRSYGFVRHLRSDPSSYVLRYRNGKLRRSGRGLSFWFLPMSAGLAEVPVDDRELDFQFQGRSNDFQDVWAQGVITLRLVQPETVAERIDFTIDLASGAYRRQPLEKLTLVVTQLAQQHAWAWISRTSLREVLSAGPHEIRDRVRGGLASDEGLTAMGVEIVSVRVSSVRPVADVERALETPARERLQQEADQATFERRALAVEKERAIAEAELQNQIELATREEQLIAQRGQNERRRVTDAADAQRIDAESRAARTAIESAAKADAIRKVDGAGVEAEQARMAIYRELPPSVLLGLAARELAGKLQRIDHLNVTPDLLGAQLSDLLEAGAKRLAKPEPSQE